jgi:hypothetical protein
VATLKSLVSELAVIEGFTVSIATDRAGEIEEV